MISFKSKRERRLWIWTAVLVAGIFASIGLVRPLFEFLQGKGLDVTLFLLGMLMVGSTIIIQGLRVRPDGVEIAVILGITAAYILVFMRTAILPERTHLIEYGVLAVFILEALKERKSQGGKVPVPWLLAILFTSLIGAFDEFLQLFVPGRFFDTEDIIFNVLAAVMAVLASLALNWARNRSSKKEET